MTALDGRTARRDRNRVAVLDAVIELFSEGDLDPSPEAVAARSGVSLRSVYRYVADKEDLARAAIDRHVERVGHLFLISDIGNGSLAARIDRFVDARLALYAAIAPTNRAARLRAPTAPVIARQLERARRQTREQLERHFKPELSRMPARERRNVAAAADAITQIESLDLYHLSYGFTARVTRDVLVAALARLLG